MNSTLQIGNIITRHTCPCLLHCNVQVIRRIVLLIPKIDYAGHPYRYILNNIDI